MILYMAIVVTHTKNIFSTSATLQLSTVVIHSYESIMNVELSYSLENEQTIVDWFMGNLDWQTRYLLGGKVTTTIMSFIIFIKVHFHLPNNFFNQNLSIFPNITDTEEQSKRQEIYIYKILHDTLGGRSRNIFMVVTHRLRTTAIWLLSYGTIML